MRRRKHGEPLEKPGIDPASVAGTVTAGPKLVIAADTVFQPPMPAAELPPLGHCQPPRRRRALK